MPSVIWCSGRRIERDGICVIKLMDPEVENVMVLIKVKKMREWKWFIEEWRGHSKIWGLLSRGYHNIILQLYFIQIPFFLSWSTLFYVLF